MPPGPKPGTPRLGGRQKGTPNKMTADVKAMILSALEKAGGDQYLLFQSRKNPQAFMQLVGKVLPMQVSVDPEANKLIVEIVRYAPPLNGAGHGKT